MTETRCPVHAEPLNDNGDCAWAGPPWRACRPSEEEIARVVAERKGE